MKVIFLDFDGVILPLPQGGKFEPNLRPSVEAINNLNLLVNLTQAEVVVSSSWREGRSVEELEGILKMWGYKWSVLDKLQWVGGDEDRGKDVRVWLSLNTVESFVLIDDDRTDLEEFARQMVSPAPDKGLRLHDVFAAEKILNGEV